MAEKLLTLNLRKYLVAVPRSKRLRKAPAYIRERVAHYMKLDIENVSISRELNSELMKSHSKSMVPIKLSISIENNAATVKKFSDKKVEKKPEAKDAAKAPAKQKQEPVKQQGKA